MPLLSQLKQQLMPWITAQKWYVGFSGGMDSTILLHLLAAWRKQDESLPTLHAVYIHHGLQHVAEAWPAHCKKICDGLGVSLSIISVTVAKQASLEQAAREARYSAFNQLIGENDILLTAQHQRDQAETVLFRLVRGAGVKGLTGIPTSRALLHGHVVRPLLAVSYNALQQYAAQQQLQWVEDPSNHHTDFARNYIRHNVLPVLQQQWPQAIHNIAQAAEHLNEAELLLAELAQQDSTTLQAASLYPWLSMPSLLFAPLAKLSLTRQKNILSHCLADYTLLPSTAHWQGWRDMLAAATDAMPVWQLHSGYLCRTAGRIWFVPNAWLQSLIQPIKNPNNTN